MRFTSSLSPSKVPELRDSLSHLHFASPGPTLPPSHATFLTFPRRFISPSRTLSSSPVPIPRPRAPNTHPPGLPSEVSTPATLILSPRSAPRSCYTSVTLRLEVAVDCSSRFPGIRKQMFSCSRDMCFLHPLTSPHQPPPSPSPLLAEVKQ
ncbi:hypothetical protein E2C01_074761 [Portunus trituberculatus]|uniref:Uncharacterized protein n=1 Tax=Portunus trituberculatus TaxID=210409 RepID=A0A5B7I6P4_PORTR|nr:hypothetical protein [Portunus trituberculatus]